MTTHDCIGLPNCLVCRARRGDFAHHDIAASLERQDAFYRANPRSIPGYGSDQPQGIEEQYRAAARERRRREARVPE